MRMSMIVVFQSFAEEGQLEVKNMPDAYSPLIKIKSFKVIWDEEEHRDEEVHFCLWKLWLYLKDPYVLSKSMELHSWNFIPVNPIHAGVFLVLLFKIHVAPRKKFYLVEFFWEIITSSTILKVHKKRNSSVKRFCQYGMDFPKKSWGANL